jgi:anti-anti-sigma factor
MAMSTETPNEPGKVTLAVETVDGVVIVRVVGDVDMMTSHTVRKALYAAVDDRPRGLIVDLDEVRFLGSDGLAMLISCQDYAGSDIPFALVTSNPLSRRPLELTGLAQLFTVHSTRGAAIADIS